MFREALDIQRKTQTRWLHLNPSTRLNNRVCLNPGEERRRTCFRPITGHDSGGGITASLCPYPKPGLATGKRDLNLLSYSAVEASAEGAGPWKEPVFCCEVNAKWGPLPFLWSSCDMMEGCGADQESQVLVLIIWGETKSEPIFPPARWPDHVALSETAMCGCPSTPV